MYMFVSVCMSLCASASVYYMRVCCVQCWAYVFVSICLHELVRVHMNM